MSMKIYDLHGRPRPNKQQDVIREMREEGLLDIDMADWDLLNDIENDGGDGDEDEDDGGWNEGWNEEDEDWNSVKVTG
jgi:hypothetical protein